MRGPLLCVGGPLNGQHREVPAGARCLVIHQAPESWVLDAFMDSSKSAEVPNTVTIREAVYKVDKLTFNGPGMTTTLTVLSYFGSKAADRPAGFYL